MSTSENTPAPTTAPVAPAVPTSLSQACDPSSALGTAGATGATATFGTVDAVKIYLERNAPHGMADVTRFRDGEGRTALHWALAFKNFDLAAALLYGPFKEEALAMMMEPGLLAARRKAEQDTGSEEQQAQQKDVQMHQQQQQHQNGNGNNSGAFFVAPWALPGDSSGTTVLATACAVNAPFQLITDLISIATALPVPQIGNPTDPASITFTKDQATLQASCHPFISASDATGNTPLHLSASRGNMRLVTLFLAYGADPRAQNKRGQTTLHRLISRSDVSAVEALIHFARRRFPTNVKQFVNVPDVNGDTALHYASMEENRDLGEFLLRNGAIRESKNKQGKEFWQL